MFDTGASTGLIPLRSDFINYRPADVAIKAVASTGEILGIGTVLQNLSHVVVLPSLCRP